MPPVAFVAPSHVVRVDLTRLDELLRIMGDMVVHRARLEEVSGVPIALVSTGSDREETIIRDDRPLAAWLK